MPTTFDSTLISHTLQTELSVNQRSRFIETVPVFALTQTLYPEVFSSVSRNAETANKHGCPKMGGHPHHGKSMKIENPTLKS